MRIVVVGAGGQLGTAVVRELSVAGADVRPLTRADLDVTDAAGVAALGRGPLDAIVNCTAYNNVDGAEDEPDLAMAVNRDAVAALAAAATAAGAALVHYSTDFVFDGRAEAPYPEDAPTGPLGAYGRSKLAGEAMAARAPRHYVLRLSSVFGGARGQGAGGRSAIDWIVDAIRAGREVRAFEDRTVTPSYTRDVAWATRRLLEGGAAPGIYHGVSSGWATWADLAREAAGCLGLAARITPVAMETVPMRARRPLRCALANGRLAAAGIRMPSWQDALERHIEGRLRETGSAA